MARACRALVSVAPAPLMGVYESVLSLVQFDSGIGNEQGSALSRL